MKMYYVEDCENGMIFAPDLRSAFSAEQQRLPALGRYINVYRGAEVY